MSLVLAEAGKNIKNVVENNGRGVCLFRYRLQATSYRLQVTGFRLQATGYRLSAEGGPASGGKPET